MTSLEQQTTQPRYHGLDGLRAVMMLLGLVLHAVVSYMHLPANNIWPFRDPSTSAIWTHILFFIHVFRMPVFYVMAGFFAALLLERRGMIRMARNRTTRILVPFVVGWIILKPLTNLGFVFANATKGTTLADGWSAVLAAWSAYRYTDSTIHLWFLYYLMLLYAAGLVLTVVARRLPASWRRASMDLFGRLVASRWRAIWFAIPTAGTLAMAPSGLLKTSVSFVPDPLTFVSYGVFFGFGWLLYQRRETLPTFDRHAWRQVVFALVLVPINLAAAERGLFHPAEQVAITTGVTAVTGALIVWLLTFGLTGLFQRYLDRPVPVVRYIVDASYWVYLIHLPFTIWIPGLLSGVAWPSGVKIVAVLVLATPIWWVSYEFLVRGSFIGLVLNGRRYPRGLPTLASAPPERLREQRDQDGARSLLTHSELATTVRATVPRENEPGT